ncbi:WecB/TagA/CpsF family glycosyltransferase [Adonisia turfae]|uniref:Glycosyltransferase n=1 Tax=Adonisia turfae CCMR0081 TaxID=2292702 RepID=A0A6M0RW91_9CYAN|nr:WecB/TagA/CpsF family glycosyltransferase [Adonisia turfae]NEZ60507.1 glycosyltransferase [Adonisia turfae CCMR0081]
MVSTPAPVIGPLKQLSVMGLPVHQSTDYVGWLMEHLRSGGGGHVVTLNAEMCIQAEANADLQQIIQNATLVIPDGAGVKLYFQWVQRHPLKRYPGIEFAVDVLKKLHATETVVFYGGSPGMATAAAEHWQRLFPDLNIEIAQHGYLSETEQLGFQHQLQELQPSVIFVGLGVPRQEIWIANHRQLCPNAIWVGVGGSFDIWAGKKRRAPRWMCNNNLEWLYRLYQEPWRWRRMLALPKFVFRSIGYDLDRRV